MDSLDQGHPGGSLPVWETRTDNAKIRGDFVDASSSGNQLLLDGQQRAGSLYRIVRGNAPNLFDVSESNERRH